MPTDGRRRRTPTGPSVEGAAKAFTSEFEVITLGERNAGYVASKSDIIRVHLLPFFGNTALEDITADKVHEYICLRLLEGADIYQVAKNYRTSVEMIEKYYGRHLKNNIDA